MNLNLLTHEDFQSEMQKMRAELLAAINEAISSKSFTQKEWIKTAEAREFLTCTQNTLTKLRIQQKITARNLNGSWYYSLPSIRKAIDSSVQF